MLPSRVDSSEVTGTVLSDINLLVNTGGRERTEDEFRALYRAAGFELTAVLGESTNYRVIEGSPV